MCKWKMYELGTKTLCIIMRSLTIVNLPEVVNL